MKPYFFLKNFKSLPVIILQNQRRVQVSKLSRAVKIKTFNSKTPWSGSEINLNKVYLLLAR